MEVLQTTAPNNSNTTPFCPRLKQSVSPGETFFLGPDDEGKLGILDDSDFSLTQVPTTFVVTFGEPIATCPMKIRNSGPCPVPTDQPESDEADGINACTTCGLTSAQRRVVMP